MDVAQNVFLIVHRQLAAFEGRAQLTTWLFSICRRVARDYVRSGRVRYEVVTDVSYFTKPEEPSDTPLDRLDARDRARLLDAILEKMPEKARVVFVLFELEEMSGDDVAAFLEIPVGTVRSRLRVAREIFTREATRVHQIAKDTDVASRDEIQMSKFMVRKAAGPAR
jgi:RNA polymerase sigma-70 factor (ECF subfamily)